MTMRRGPSTIRTSLTAEQLDEADAHICAATDILEGHIPVTYLMQLINLSLRLKRQGDAKRMARPPGSAPLSRRGASALVDGVWTKLELEDDPLADLM